MKNTQRLLKNLRKRKRNAKKRRSKMTDLDATAVLLGRLGIVTAGAMFISPLPTMRRIVEDGDVGGYSEVGDVI
jgi:hypothetical protein